MTNTLDILLHMYTQRKQQLPTTSRQIPEPLAAAASETAGAGVDEDVADVALVVHHFAIRGHRGELAHRDGTVRHLRRRVTQRD